MSAGSAYLEATLRIPEGETRTFGELAALARRPGAARAAGRAIRLCPERARWAWHRVVRSDGGLAAEPARARAQLRRLRREGARPRARETIQSWLRRTGRRWAGDYRSRVYARADAAIVSRWRPDAVEGFRDEATARARGFRPLGRAQAVAPHPLPAPSEIASSPPVSPGISLVDRIGAVDWTDMSRELSRHGYALIPRLLSTAECAAILRDATERGRFERSVEMAPRGFGVGTYHYYREPLPAPAQALRELLYPRLASIARQQGFGAQRSYPDTLEEFWALCRRSGQSRSSSILLCYGPGGVNHPHRDVYGTRWFPFQAVLVLSERGEDFEGGELAIFEEATRGEVIAHRVAVGRGDVVVFGTRERRERPDRRPVPLRHGMYPLVRGRRYALGLVFHLAR